MNRLHLSTTGPRQVSAELSLSTQTDYDECSVYHRPGPPHRDKESHSNQGAGPNACDIKDKMKMAFRVDDEELSSYQAFLHSTKYPHITQGTHWPQVKARSGWQATHFVQLKENAELRVENIEAVAQLLSIKDRNTAQPFCYLPRGPVTQGLPTDHGAALSEIIGTVYEYAKSLKATSLLIDPPWEANEDNFNLLQELAELFPGGEIFRGSDLVHGQPRFNAIVDLTPFADYEEWLASLNGKHRYKLRRAQSSGAIKQISDNRDLNETLYSLIEDVAQKHEITHRPKEYFYDLFDAYDEAFFTVVTLEESPNSISLNIPYENTIYNLYVGNDTPGRKAGTPALMYASVVEEAFRRGIEHVDFGGAFALDSSDNLYRFKHQFIPKTQVMTEYVGEIFFRLA